MSHGYNSIKSDWEKIQYKTFLHWANFHLKSRNIEIKSLEIDLSEGINLIILLEVLSKREITKYIKKPTLKIHCLNNLAVGFDRIFEEGVKLENIGGLDIYEGNIKLTMGLIWSLIQHYEFGQLHKYIVGEQQINPKEFIINWLKKQTENYKNIKIIDLTTSFNNGLVLCALVDSRDGNLIDYENLNPRNGVNNNAFAMKFLEEKFSVPHLLEAEDISNKEVDEKSMMTYMTIIIQKLEGIKRKEKTQVGGLPYDPFKEEEERLKKLSEEERLKREEELRLQEEDRLRKLREEEELRRVKEEELERLRREELERQRKEKIQSEIDEEFKIVSNPILLLEVGMPIFVNSDHTGEYFLLRKLVDMQVGKNFFLPSGTTLIRESAEKVKFGENRFIEVPKEDLVPIQIVQNNSNNVFTGKGKLTVQLLGAKDLPESSGKFSKTNLRDVFFVIGPKNYPKSYFKTTSVAKKTLNPVYENVSFEFQVAGNFTLQVLAKDFVFMGKDEEIGTVDISSSHFHPFGNTHDKWFKFDNLQTGFVHLKVTLNQHVTKEGHCTVCSDKLLPIPKPKKCNTCGDSVCVKCVVKNFPMRKESEKFNCPSCSMINKN